MSGMKPVWEYFEYLNEILYAADMDTFELLYLNKYGRETFLLNEDYRGKKCYQVLQGLDEPCPFCTNSELKEGEFLNWVYRNPLLRKSFRIRDTMLTYQGRRCRMEFAVRLEDSQGELGEVNLIDVRNYEEVINECLLRAHSVLDADEALNIMLEYLGGRITCDGLIIYEIREKRWIIDSYSWSKSGHKAEKKLVEFSFGDSIKKWYEEFFHNEPILMSDLEGIWKKTPELHELLNPQQEKRMIIIPLLRRAEVIGFFRIDNPGEEKMYLIAECGKMLSHYMVSMIERRDLVRNLEQISFHDQMTGALNRYALNSYLVKTRLNCDTGVVYCDVIALKKINDQYGHSSGDQRIIQAYQMLGSIFIGDQIFRVGGDEFFVVCEKIGREEFEEKVQKLRQTAVTNHCEISIGSVWSEAGDCLFQKMMNEADERMYQDKRNYYRCHGLVDVEGRPDTKPKKQEEQSAKCQKNSIRAFMENYYFDIDSLIQSLTMQGTVVYLYFGDMQENLYYISDNLKEDFGFESNLVTDFVTLLEQRIYGPDQQMHAEEMMAMLKEKREHHSIRYRIYDKNGDLIWLHCQGILKWDKDKQEPLFFSGNMISLTNEAEVDQVTGLLKLSFAEKKIEELRQMQMEIMLLCIKFRGFADINRAFGRDVGDAVLKEVGGRMELEMGSQFSFYRMDGACFLGISCIESDPDDPVAKIQQIVKDILRKYKIHLVAPCAIGVLHSGKEAYTPQELIDGVSETAHTAKAFAGLNYLESTAHIAESCWERSDISMTLNSCVEHDFRGFRTVIQPQVVARDGYIFGGEVLLRWENDGTPVQPSKFVPMLEQTQLIVPVGKWVLEQALKAAKEILTFRPDFILSVNVSYLQIVEQTFFPLLLKQMERFGIPGENLMLELTETHFDEMPDHLRQFIQNCQQHKIRFALDDFGNAYSGLELLLSYPADLIKLDRTLMCEITSSEDKKRFITSIVYACHQFERKVCVEGVETSEELAVILQTDCDFIQGFYFYKPMEWNELVKMLREQWDKNKTE